MGEGDSKTKSGERRGDAQNVGREKPARTVIAAFSIPFAAHSDKPASQRPLLIHTFIGRHCTSTRKEKEVERKQAMQNYAVVSVGRFSAVRNVHSNTSSSGTFDHFSCS